VNPAHNRILGWQPEQLLGRDFAEFLAAEDRADALERHRQAVATRLGYRRVDCCLANDGRVIRLETSSVMVEQPDGRHFRVAALLPIEFSGEAGEKRVMIAGRVQLIGLAEVRTALGERWPALAERAFGVAESLLRARLAPTDVFTRTEKGFVICFASLGEDEARFKAVALADEIQRRLLGELAPEAALTLSFVAPIELEPEEDGPLPSIAGLVEAKLQALRQASERRLYELLARAAETGTLEMEPVCNPAGQRAPLGIGRFRDGQGGELERLVRTLAGDEALALEMNLLVLSAAGHRLAAPAGDGDAAMCLVPVDFNVLLARKQATKYVEACRALSAVARERLVFELRRVAPDAAPTRIDEALQLLSSFARGVAIELGDPAQPLLDFERCRVPIVTLRAAALVRGGVVRGEVAKLVKTLHKHRVRLLAKDIVSAKLLAELRKAEIDFYAGPALTG
jgi:PAS domain-containing protein